MHSRTQPFPVAFLVSPHNFLRFIHLREIYPSPLHPEAPSPMKSISFSLFSYTCSTLSYIPNIIIDARRHKSLGPGLPVHLKRLMFSHNSLVVCSSLQAGIGTVLNSLHLSDSFLALFAASRAPPIFWTFSVFALLCVSENSLLFTDKRNLQSHQL